MHNRFLIVWNTLGLEEIVDIQDLEQQDTMNRLKNEPARSIRETLNYFSMRARYNAHRIYEMYSIHTSEDVSKDDLVDLFEQDPQAAADLIRERGTKILSQRIEGKVKIT